MKAYKRRGWYTDPFWGVVFAAGIVVGILLCLLFSPPAQATDKSGKEDSAVNGPLVGNTKEYIYTAPTEDVSVETDAGFQDQTGEPQLVSMGWFTVTAYCPCVKCCGIWSAEHPDRPDGFIQRTASGTIPVEGRTVAVDPSVIPMGSTVYFENADGLVSGYVAEDTGGAIKGNRIDIFFNSHEAALDWGIRELEVFQIGGAS